MKNFKKVLALVLVVVMAMSFATVSSAAFTDAASITKAEAVDVLSAIGVINGYEDGSFKPEGDVTRAEMAKMIATILNKGEDVGTMYAGACTFADAVNHWAAGYIAYCAQEGIINGKNAATFDPDANVTGTEAAKMVLGALGHKADKANLVGSAWASTTLSLAKKAALIGEQNNMTANMGQALNRENAAQLLFNGLKATMVEYTGGTNITIGNVVLNQGATAANVAQTVNSDFGAGNAATQELAEEYFSKLTVTVGGADAFGRTCNVWTYETEEVGSYNVAPYTTYTVETTLGQLYTDLGKVDAAKLTNITYYVDGENVSQSKAATMANLASGNVTDTIGGQGVTTEVYFDADTMTLNIVEINTYAAKVTGVYPAVKDANGDITAAAYITIAPLYNGKTATSGQYQLNGQEVGTTVILTDAFTTADKEAIVTYTIGDDVNKANYNAQLQTVAKTTAVTGTNGGYSEIAQYTVVSTIVGGTTYNVNVNAQGQNKYGTTFGADETIYLDANNNVVYTTAVASNDYLLVKANAATETFANGYSALVVLQDGTEKVVELAAVHDGGTGVQNNTVYNYIVGTDGKYTLSNGVQNTVSAGTVTNKVPTLVAGNNPVYADANTIFVVGVKDQNTNVTTYTVYTGIAAVPTFQVNNSTIYYAVNASGNAAVVFCENATLTGSSTTAVMALYKTGNESKTTAGVGNSYRNVRAVVDGQVTTVKLTDTAYNNLTAGQFTLVSGGLTDVNGNYTSLNPVTTQGNLAQATTFTTFGAYLNGNITLDNAMYVDASVPVVVWNTTEKALQITTVEAVQAMTAQTTGIYTHELAAVGGAITGIYMTVDY